MGTPATVTSPSAQDITDFSAINFKGSADVYDDAVTTYPTGVANILADDGTTWDIGDASATQEALFKITLNDPFTACPTAEINLLDILVDYTAVVALGTGVIFPGIWVAWRKADNSLVKLVDLAGANEHDVNVRQFLPASDTITIDDIQNGYGLVGCNVVVSSPTPANISTVEFNYIAARFSYDATSCVDDSTDAEFALPVQLCNPTTEGETSWEMTSGELTIGATSTADLDGLPIGCRVVSIYNPDTTTTLIVRFADTTSATHSQRIPPNSSYSFGVGDSKIPIDHTTMTVENTSGAPITIVWNASTTGGN